MYRHFIFVCMGVCKCVVYSDMRKDVCEEERKINK